MPLYEFSYQALGSTDDPSLVGRARAPASDTSTWNRDALRSGFLRDGVLGVLNATVQKLKPEGPGRTVALNVTLLVEASDMYACDRMAPPTDILNQVAGALSRPGEGGGVVLESDWRFCVAKPSEAFAFRYGVERRGDRYVAGQSIHIPGVDTRMGRQPATHEPHHAASQFGVVLTRDPLTVEQLRVYGLVALVDPICMAPIADRVAAILGKRDQGWIHAAAYADLAETEPDVLQRTIRQVVFDLDIGVRYAIADYELLQGAVTQRLDEAVRKIEQEHPISHRERNTQ